MKQFTYNNKVILQIMKRQQQIPLQDMLQMQDVIAKSKQIQKNIALYQAQKKRRTILIDQQIDALQAQSIILKQVIKKTLQKHQQKAISFPAVGSIKMKPGTPKWKILNQQQLLAKISSLNGQKQALQKQLIKMKPSLVRKNIDPMLTAWQKANDWPQGIKQLVYRESAGPSISISFVQDVHVHASDQEQDVATPLESKIKHQIGQGEI